MALCTLTPVTPRIPSPNPLIRRKNPNYRRIRAPFVANSTRLVTFLGKGGSGKTSAAVLAAKIKCHSLSSSLVYESARLNSGSTEGKTSTEIWNDIEQILEKASVSFSDPSKIGCYLVMDPSRSASVTSALRYWGCAIQAGTQICGAFGFPSQSSLDMEEIIEKVSPLNYALVPNFSADHSLDWDAILNSLSTDVKHMLSLTSNRLQASVKFDSSQKSVTLFMPGFDKSDIKLYQYRGGAELLVEAGDQRRIIQLPRGMQGKVGGAKFIDRNLVVTLR